MRTRAGIVLVIALGALSLLGCLRPQPNVPPSPGRGLTAQLFDSYRSGKSSPSPSPTPVLQAPVYAPATPRPATVAHLPATAQTPSTAPAWPASIPYVAASPRSESSTTLPAVLPWPSPAPPPPFVPVADPMGVSAPPPAIAAPARPVAPPVIAPPVIPAPAPALIDVGPAIPPAIPSRVDPTDGIGIGVAVPPAQQPVDRSVSRPLSVSPADELTAPVITRPAETLADPSPAPPLPTETASPTPSSTPTSTSTPRPNDTPTPPPTATPVACAGDERVSFDPSDPLAGQAFTILVRSSRAHQHVRLEGPGGPQFTGATSEGGSWVWRWQVVAGSPGPASYSFWVGGQSCATGTASIQAPVPTATATPSLVPDSKRSSVSLSASKTTSGSTVYLIAAVRNGSGQPLADRLVGVTGGRAADEIGPPTRTGADGLATFAITPGAPGDLSLQATDLSTGIVLGQATLSVAQTGGTVSPTPVTATATQTLATPAPSLTAASTATPLSGPSTPSPSASPSPSSPTPTTAPTSAPTRVPTPSPAATATPPPIPGDSATRPG